VKVLEMIAIAIMIGLVIAIGIVLYRMDDGE
jgi:capsular polysaccharide biosynthesis protein